ncbi:hypothetical protein [Winogradskyella sp.]|uniref:hypothetical protein n=1 Tax=Winogradskyella sp. TaxID=1883156 RepID=UPI0025FDE2AA|nr:hypothetical protein [Winogradskyella sp.]
MGVPIPIPIGIKDAETWTLDWQTKYPKHAKAFLIPVDDLLVCFQEMGLKVTTDANGVISANPTTSKIRAYVALDKGEEKLLMVGTIKKGVVWEDIVANRKKTTTSCENLVGDPLIGSGVYDFTTPCPAECDPNSSLFHKVP